jgi:tol-pal system protein YbgF
MYSQRGGLFAGTSGVGVIAGAALALSCLSPALPAMAQQTDLDRRLDRIEKQLRETRSIVFQGRDTGQPVVVKPDGPDPAVTALQSRVDDLDQTLRRLSGQVEVATHDLDETRRTSQQSHDSLIELRAQLQALTERVGRLETQITAQQQQQAAAAASAQEPALPSDDRRGRAGPHGASDATARAQADDQGALGGGASSEGASYRNAMALQDQGDYAGASQAWQTYISHYGSSAKGREARYHLGEALYIQSDYGEAARAYAEALKGWPRASWAADAAVKLSLALTQLGRRDEACSVVGEFQTRYASGAAPAVKARARSVRSKASCSAA